jgi:hypothetical protein
MSDLKTATDDFFARVDRHTPDEVKRVREVLTDLLQWSEEHSWGLSFTHRAPKGPIRYCVKGVVSPFWVFTPHTKDGARLTLLTASHPKFPEDLRDEARQMLAKLDGRKPDPNEVPMVGYLKLLWPSNRLALHELMTRAINRIYGREPAVLSDVS